MNIDRQSRRTADIGSGWPRATLRTHLVAIVLAATLPLAVFMAIRIVAEGRLQREALVANLRSSARAVAMVVDRELTASRDALTGLAQADTLQRGDLAAFEQRLRSRGPLRPGWSRLTVLDANGRALFEVDGANAARLPTPATEIQALALAWGAVQPKSVLLSVLDTAVPERGTWIGVTATTADGKRYLLASRVGLEVWQSLLKGAAPEGDGYTTLFDEQHRVLARTDAPQRFAGQALPAAAVAGMASRPSGAQKTQQLGGGETYVGWQLIGVSESVGAWGVGVGVPAAAFDSAQASAERWAFGVATACLLLGVVLSMGVARRVVLPLQRLARGGGGAAAATPISVTEIALLGEALNASERHRGELMALETAARRDAEATSRTKDRLLGMLGHELRNPLNAIVTSIEVLRVAESGSKMAESARDVLSRQVRKLTGMVDDLLDVGQVMSEQITLVRRPLDLQALIGRSVAASRPNADKKAQQLQLDAAARVWVEADAGRIEQVMTQLLDNAIKHTPAKGTIRVELAVADGIASVSVVDSGPGIDAELLRRVFEPFVQGEIGLDRSGGGLGIGLALVKRLVELHGGSVQAHSSSQGSRFVWSLPAIQPGDVSSEKAVLRIGLVDDNADALASMRAMLELEGHRVSTAIDGPAGVTMLLTQRPELALVDIGLPGFDGHEVARRCRAAGYRGRMVAISGYGQAHDLERSLAQGFDAHLVKPLDLARLLPLMRFA